MQYKNESQLNLRFLKTFVLSAERIAAAGQSREMSVTQYAEYIKVLSREYPALENLAWKMNVQYGSAIRTFDVDGEDDYGCSRAFVALSRSLSEEMRQRFSGVRPWHDGNFTSLPQQLDAAFVNADFQNNYWLYHTLSLSLGEIDIKKSEIQQQMYDEIDRIRLSDRVAAIMENYGLAVNEEYDDDINDMLCDVGFELLSAKKKIDSGEAAISFRDRMQENWEFTDNNNTLLSSLMKPMEALGQVVRNHQKKARMWDNSAYYLNKIREAVVDVPSNEQVQEEIYPLGRSVTSAKVRTWADGKEMPDYLEGYHDDNIQKIDRESLFWKNYENAGDVFHTPEWRERIGLVLGGWSQMLWEETGEIDGRLDNFWEDKFSSKDDDDGSDDDEREYSAEDDENAQLLKEDALGFAGKFMVLAEASEKYLGIVLNDSGISQKTLDDIAKEDGVNDDAFRVLELIIDTFDKNYEVRDFFMSKTVLSADEDSAVFIERLSELPHSPAKREIANLMQQNLQEQKRDVDSEDEIVTGNFVEQIENLQQDKYEILQDFIDYAIGTYPEMSGEKAADFTEDFSYAVSANFIIPLYLGLEPFPEAKEKILEELNGYERYSPGAKNFMDGLVDSYLKAVRPLHEENKRRVDNILLSGDDQQVGENPMAFAVNEYKDVMLRSDDLQRQIECLRDISRGEEAVYRKYTAFQEKRDMYHISDNELRRMLIEAKLFVR